MDILATVSPQRRWSTALLVLAIAIRLGWQLHVDLYGRPETWEYDEIARNVLEGRGYVRHYLGTDWLTFGATPLYPLLLAVLHVLGGGPDGYVFVGAAQALMSAGLCLAAYAIARRVADELAGMLAALVVAVHPGLVIYSAKVHELTLDTLIAAVVVVALLDVARRRGRAEIAWLSVAGALVALARPTLMPFAAGTIAALFRSPPRWALLVPVAVAIAVSVPWAARNAAILGSSGPLSPVNCVTLWIGNNPLATGGSLASDGASSIVSTMPEEMRARVFGRPEQEQGRVFCEEAFRFIDADRPGFVRWWAQKLGYFWWSGPQAGRLYPAGWIDLYQIGYALELVLVLAGAAIVWRRGWRFGAAVVIFELVVVSVGQSLFYVDGRHRLMLEPSLAALAGAGAAGILRAALPVLGPVRA